MSPVKWGDISVGSRFYYIDFGSCIGFEKTSSNTYREYVNVCTSIYMDRIFARVFGNFCFVRDCDCGLVYSPNPFAKYGAEMVLVDLNLVVTIPECRL